MPCKSAGIRREGWKHNPRARTLQAEQLLPRLRRRRPTSLSRPGPRWAAVCRSRPPGCRTSPRSPVRRRCWPRHRPVSRHRSVRALLLIFGSHLPQTILSVSPYPYVHLSIWLSVCTSGSPYNYMSHIKVSSSELLFVPFYAVSWTICIFLYLWIIL